MGREAVAAMGADPALVLAGAVDPAVAGEVLDGVTVRSTLSQALKQDGPFDVVLDLTNPTALMRTAPKVIEAGIALVVGTSGCDGPRLEKLRAMVKKKRGALVWVIPNFAVGAVLMMRFAEMAAKVMPHVEIVEYHHDRKQDYPSGTAIATAERIVQANPKVRMDSPDRVAHLSGGRGGAVGNVRVHAVRLPGFVASQEVLFGGVGQTLKLRHDTIHREAFMPGVVLALNHSAKLTGFHLGLEEALGL